MRKIQVIQDVDVPKSQWNSYLRKYNDKYIVKRDESNIYQIQCYKTSYDVNVQLYSLKDKLLAVLFNYKSMRGIKKLERKMPKYCNIVQQGDGDCTIVFPECHLHDLDKLGIIHLKHKKQYSNEQLEKMRQRMYQLRKLGKIGCKSISLSS